MSVIKPAIADVRFGVDGSNADAANIAAPSSGQRDTGWTNGQIPTSTVENYLKNRPYRWFQFVDEVFKIAGTAIADLKLSGQAIFGGQLVVGGQALTFTNFTFTANSGTDQLTATAHPLQTGDGPLQTATTTTLPGGLAAATNYFAIFVDANNFKLATSYANAVAGFAIDITSNGTGTQTLQVQGGTTRGTDLTVSRNVSILGQLTSGLIAAANQSFVVSGTGRFKHGTLTLPIPGSRFVQYSDGTPITFANVTYTATAATDLLNVPGHGFQTGDGPLTTTTTGTLPGGLTAATPIFAIVIDSSNIKVATSFNNAVAGFAIDITSAGSGTHTLVVGAGSTGRPRISAAGVLSAGSLHARAGVELPVGKRIQAVRFIVKDNGAGNQLQGSITSVDSTGAVGTPVTSSVSSAGGQQTLAITGQSLTIGSSGARYTLSIDSVAADTGLVSIDFAEVDYDHP